MIYLIDFENVNNDGLDGFEYLTVKDSLYIFYSQSTPNIRRQIAEKIFSPMMDVHLYKLYAARKNAIDFYIASKAGQLIEEQHLDQIAIVTKDSGFQSIADYWSRVSEKKCRVILEKSIANCMLKAQNGGEAYGTVKYDRAQVSLESQYREYEKKRELGKRVGQKLQGTEFEQEQEKVIRICSNADSKKVLYLSALKTFGRARGTRLYADIKDMELETA